MGKKKNTRPRTITLSLDAPPPWAQGLALRETDFAPFWVGGDQIKPVSVKWIDYGYAREKGPKSIFRASEFSPMAGLHPNGQITTFPQILAIDTNTRLIGGSRVSVSAVVAMKVDSASGGYVRGGTAFLYAMEMWNTADDAEAIGWEILINLINNEPEHFRRPLLILTDYDLARHERINRREEPVRRGVYLPDGVQLAYASYDSGGELLSTKLIRAADRWASKIMSDERLSLSLEGLLAIESSDYSHFRQWQTSESVFS